MGFVFLEKNYLSANLMEINCICDMARKKYSESTLCLKNIFFCRKKYCCDNLSRKNVLLRCEAKKNFGLSVNVDINCIYTQGH